MYSFILSCLSLLVCSLFMLLYVSIVHSFVLLTSIPLYERATIYLSIYLLMESRLFPVWAIASKFARNIQVQVFVVVVVIYKEQCFLFVF